MRTTIDLDPMVLAELKKRQLAEGKTLGEVVSELLAPVLHQPITPRREVVWPIKPMGALLDIEDKEAIWAALDRT